jgi:hypothetical protein
MHGRSRRCIKRTTTISDYYLIIIITLRILMLRASTETHTQYLSKLGTVRLAYITLHWHTSCNFLYHPLNYTVALLCFALLCFALLCYTFPFVFISSGSVCWIGSIKNFSYYYQRPTVILTFEARSLGCGRFIIYCGRLHLHSQLLYFFFFLVSGY